MDFLKDLIQRCHQRHAKPLQQRKTVPVPSMYTRGPFFRYKVYCARKYPVPFDDLAAAGISFMPIGHAPENDRGPRHFGGELFQRRTTPENWGYRRLDTSWGIQVYTGIPSEHQGARWHDFNFTYQALCVAPDAVLTCIEALLSTIANPLLTLSKSGGLRFSCRVPDYLHPDTEDEKLYIYKHAPTPENPQQQDVYLQILGEKGYNRWDARYEILHGNLLEPPIIGKEALFAPINALRAVLHQPAPEEIKQTPTIPAMPLRLGSYQLDLAKEALMKHGFSYVRRDNGIHYWIPSTGKETDPASASKEMDDVEVSLWEDAGVVWIRAASPDVGVPTTPTPITDVWDDTGIVPALTETGLPVTDKVLAVREGLSPLSIKRSPAILQKAESTEKIHEIREKNAIQMRRVLEGTARIRGLMSPGTGADNDYETELFLLNNTAIHLSMSASTKLAEGAEHHFQAQNVGSVARWKDRMHRWDQVKDIPANVRLEAPFQHGNVCEDPERCDALAEKGGNPSESICPQCSVYTECQDRGYLSQPIALQRAKAQISTIPNLFFDPQYADIVDEMLESVEETQRLCIIDGKRLPDLFSRYMLSKNILEEWSVNWQGAALGNFAKTLLNALEIKGKLHGDAVKGVRTVIQSFEWQAEEIIRQMCQVNVRGRVVEGGVVDIDTGEELARLSIEFEGGASVYIPLDNNAADRLMAKGLPFFQLDSFVMDKNVKIPMGMAEAIELGILDTETAQDIQGFPTICSDPQWTFWHQLKRFFAHYTRDADAPIRWNGMELFFWMPPVLHPSVKRLLVMSSTLSEKHLRRAFPDEDIEVFRAEPTASVAGNQVFQIRTGIYPREAILDYDSTWDVVGVSKIGQRFLLGIRAEIETDPNVKHAIITDSEIIQPLMDITAKGNVCFLRNFQEMVPSEMHFHETKTEELQTAFEAADAIWIVGAPERPPAVIWRRAQMLFGNDGEPLSYEAETGSTSYTDERVQSIYERDVVSMLTEITESIRLDHSTGKRVVLLTGLRLPYIANRSETLLFDWEDFEVAGGLDKLPEVIATRQRFETERDNLTTESGRERVEEVLGCSSRQANRFLYKLRGGRMRPLSLREQILSLLASGAEIKTAQLIEAIQGHPDAIKHELKNLVDANKITKVRRAVYALKTEHNGTE